MKTLKDYLLENSLEKISTKEVINKLKDAGETPKEIKKDVNVNKPALSYIEFVKLFNEKCTEAINAFVKLHKRLQNDEGDDYLVRNLGKQWIDYFNKTFNEFYNSNKELNKILKQDINESINVKNFDNYHEFYNFLNTLNDFNNTANKIEQSFDTSKYENIVKARTKVSENIKNLFKSTNKLKEFLDMAWQYKTLKL